MPNIGVAWLDVRGNFGPLRTGLRRSQYDVDRSLGRMEGRATQTFKNIAKAAALGIGAAGGLAVRKAFREWEDAEKITRQTGAVLRSTGGAARVTAEDVEALADALSRKSGIDDEAIQSAENLLLTFTSVRNEAGKNNDIFAQATSIITDMSAALGQDLRGTTIQVGKALQDPIKGLTALRRVGVNFNEQQSEQVKRMVESGRQLDAQKFILRELRTEFAGSARAQATDSAKLRVAIDNLFENIGQTVGPALSDALGEVSGFVDDINAILSDDRLTGDQKFERVTDLLVDTITKGLDEAVDAAGQYGPRIAGSLIRGLAEAPIGAQLAVALFAASRLRGLFSASRTAGVQAGATFTQGMSTTVAQQGRWAGARAGLVGIGKTIIGASLLSGAAQSFAQGGDFQERIRNFASGATFGLIPNLDKDAKRAEDVERLVRGIGRARADQLPEIQRLADIEARILGFNRQQKAAIEAAVNARGRQQAGGALAGIGEQLREAGRITPALINQISAQLEDLPAKTRPKFAQAVLDWARELKKQGKIKGSLQELKNVIEAEVTGVGRLSLRGPSRLRERIASGFEAMVEAAADPTSRMAQIVSNYLDAFGAAGIGKIRGAIARDKATRAKGHRGGLAKGGFLQGQGKRDTIPIMAAPGEAVLNRHQQQPVETALRTTYGFGLSDLFRKEKRPHYMARGGFTTPNARLGGSQVVTGDTDVVASLLRALQQLARSTGRAIFIQSGRRTIGEQEALYQKYAGSRPVARPSPNAPHVRGIAADITPGSEVFGDKAGKYGLGFPVAGEPWHIQLVDASRADGGARGSGGALPDVPQLGRVEITGRESVVKDLAQAAVDKTRRAAQRLLDRTGPTAGPTTGGGSVSANRKLGRQMSRAIFGDSQWDALSELWTRESGWSHTAENPSSGAYGIPQALPASKMASAGRDWKTNAATQIRWGLSYIKGRYGSPSAALSFHDAHNWYAKGGFVDEIIREGGGEFRAKPPKGVKAPPKGRSSGRAFRRRDAKTKKRRPALPNLEDLKFRLIDPLTAALDTTIPTIQERVTALDTGFGDVPEFYPDERAVPRLQREGHNIQKLGDSFIDWSAVEQRKSQINQLLGESYKLIGTPFGASQGWMEYARNVFPKVIGTVEGLVENLKKEIARIKSKVRENTQRIKTLDRSIKRERDKKGGGDERKIERWADERNDLADENRRLAGTRTPENVNEVTEGRLGRMQGRLTDATAAVEDLRTDRQGFMGISGLGGDFAQQQADMSRLVGELGTLSTERITEAVAPSTEDTAKQQAQDQRTFLRALGDLQKQFGFNFRNLPSFAGGGRVEAPIGAPVNATVHGGELIVDPRTGALSVKVVGGIAPSKTINVVNNYQTQPEDPHVWSRNVRHELEAAI